MAAPDLVRAFVAFAVVFEVIAVDAIYVVQSSSKWGAHLAAREPASASAFLTQATGLGFCEREASKMWSKFAQICVIAGTTTEALTSAEYVAARAQFHSRPRTPAASAQILGSTIGARDRLGPSRGVRARYATMRRYLDQIGISLRASSVQCIETTLRQFAGHLATTSNVVCVADIDRTHIEAYKTWLAARPGYRKNTSLSKTALGMRMGHLSAFYQRIIEWDYPDVPARAPVYSSDRPIKDKPLPRLLDDGAAASS